MCKLSLRKYNLKLIIEWLGTTTDIENLDVKQKLSAMALLKYV